VIAGRNFPQRTISPSQHPSYTFTELQKALVVLAIVNYNRAISKAGYYTASNAYGLMSAYNTTFATITTNPNQFFMGFDVATIAHRGGLLSGLNINQVTSFYLLTLILYTFLLFMI